ncbi:MAG: hypothetical protein ACKVP0_26635 [Pirellulaceae bacterium]
MPSSRLISSLAVPFCGGILLFALAGCCCDPICQQGGGCVTGNCGLASHHRPLRHGTLPPPVPSPAVASPIPRFHPLPTHPVFESQASYLPLAPLSHDGELLAPHMLPESNGEPTPAMLPRESVK